MAIVPQHLNRPLVRVDVIEGQGSPAKGYAACVVGEDIKFNDVALADYFFSDSKRVVFDALLVAGVVDYCDMLRKRPSNAWTREFVVNIPVHEPDRWNDSEVSQALHSALRFLTGDAWSISFKARKAPRELLQQAALCISTDTKAVIPYSDGLDSLAVASLMEAELGTQLVRVRLGAKQKNYEKQGDIYRPFTSVPYQVRRAHNPESSGRSRGFKFATIGALAAHLANADTIFVPESGQGALGPPLVTVGQIYPDYRTHPAFLRHVERYFKALFGDVAQFELPRLWSTKAETLRSYIEHCQPTDSIWKSTFSCWQKNRQVSVNRRKRQCGVCAACMLRRLSIYSAGLIDDSDLYVWENLRARRFEDGRAAACTGTPITGKMREYAIAGTLHLDHLAGIRLEKAYSPSINLEISRIAKACSLEPEFVRNKLDQLLRKHEEEWNSFLEYLGNDSFIRNWAKGVRI